MNKELGQIMLDLVAEFPCCKGIEPENMNKSQSAVHWFLFHLRWGNKEFNLREAVVNWSNEDYKTFINLLDDYRDCARKA